MPDKNAMSQNSSQSNPEDPSRIPLFQIARSVNTGQAVAIGGFIVAVFLAGFGASRLLTANQFQREVLQLQQEINDLKAQLAQAHDDYETLAEASSKMIERQAVAAKKFGAKAEFLHRFVSFLESPDTEGSMHKLFVDHVCKLWKDDQNDIFDVKLEEITASDIIGNGFLSTSEIETLVAMGISKATMEEYQDLQEKVADVERRNPFVTKGPRPTPEIALAQLQKQIQNEATAKISKTVTFFDSTSYSVPESVAEAVHNNPDCKAQ